MQREADKSLIGQPLPKATTFKADPATDLAERGQALRLSAPIATLLTRRSNVGLWN
jgi:hypothetical protein